MKLCLANTKKSKRIGNRKPGSRGFTLIELMIVVVIIALLASLAVTSYKHYVLRARLSETATQLGYFAREFNVWKQVNGRYPNDSHRILPPDAKGLAINEAQWLATTALGGNWNWEGPNGYPYAGISIDGATALEEEMMQFDAIIDNGNLASGKFRRTSNGRFTYILDE